MFKKIDFFERVKKENANIMLSQSWFNSEHFNDGRTGSFPFNMQPAYKDFISDSLSIAKDKEIDLLVFPELSIPKELHWDIKDFSEKNINMMIVGGSTYLTGDDIFSITETRQPNIFHDKLYSMASIFYNGKQYLTGKKHLSPTETPAINSPTLAKLEDQCYFVNTPIGDVGVIICSRILL